MGEYEQIADFIVEYKRKHMGVGPSVRDIARGCDMSKSKAFRILNRMEDMGLVAYPAQEEAEYRLARSVYVPGRVGG